MQCEIRVSCELLGQALIHEVLWKIITLDEILQLTLNQTWPWLQYYVCVNFTRKRIKKGSKFFKSKLLKYFKNIIYSCIFNHEIRLITLLTFCCWRNIKHGIVECIMCVLALRARIKHANAKIQHA